MSSVDVFVPCYCYGHYLRECVESVLTQSHRAVRVLILDDAAPDNTTEISAALAREDSRVAIVRHEVNKGHIATYNEGIDWVSADCMLLLSADDYLLAGALDAPQAVYGRHTANMSDPCYRQSRLPDLHQRKAAFDYFMAGCADKLSDAEVLRKQMLYALSCDAVACASGAFNEGEIALADELVCFSESLFRRWRADISGAFEI